MPITCTGGLVNSVINECANLFTEGRCAPGTVLAIVLHEYDGPLSQLDAHHQLATVEAERMCHTSFHFGIGTDGTVHQYVEIEDTAWTFPPDWANDTDCGVGNWLISQGQPGIDPNCYTINIAVATGQTGVPRNNLEKKTQNNYSFNQIQAIIDLACCLVASNGVNITIDANTVWRHLGELDDLPGCRVVTSSGVAATFNDVLTCIQNCIDVTGTGIPSKAMSLCDTIECLLPAGDNPVQGPASVDWIEHGSNASGNLINNTSIAFAVNNLPFGSSYINGYNGATIRVNQTMINNRVSVTVDQGQTNFRIGFADFDLIDRLSVFSLVPDSVTGSLNLAAGIVTSTVADGFGEIVFNSVPAGTTIEFTYDTTVAPAQEESIVMTYIQSDEMYNLLGALAVPGVTELIGADCRTYTLPNPIDMPDEVCALLQQFPNGNPVQPGTQLLGIDCQWHAMPSLCTQLAGNFQGYDPQFPIYFIQPTADPTTCATVPIDGECDVQEMNLASIGINDAGALILARQRSSFQYREETTNVNSSMATDGVIGVDASGGSVTVTLVPPTGCQSNHLHIKRLDTNVAFSVTVASVNLIDNVASIVLGAVGPFSANRGESAHLFWNGTTWLIL